MESKISWSQKDLDAMYAKELDALAKEALVNTALCRYMDLAALQEALKRCGSDIDLGPLINGD